MTLTMPLYGPQIIHNKETLKYFHLDLDYKAVMTEGADVMSELSPCLSTGNVNNSAKLAKQIPDGVSVGFGIISLP